jgi:hypothetical protein
VKLDPVIIRQQIENLRLQFPELETDEESWLLSLESETDADGFLAAVVDRFDEVTSLSGGLAGKIAEFEVRLKRYEHQQQKLRSLALAIMQAAGLTKKELPTATLSVRKGSQRVVINDDASVPDELCRIKREPDKPRIKQQLLDGAAFNWATLQVSEPTLSIRTK